MNPTIFADKIFYYEGVIDSPDKIVAILESTDPELSQDSLISSWHDWTASDDSGFLFGARKMTNPDSYGNASEELKSAYDTLKNALTNTAMHYVDKNKLESGKQAPISISKYFVGAFMGPHTDSAPEPTTEHISSVLYLNDDYEGGEINFPNQGVCIKPKAGSIVVFPSVPPYVHESKEIISGTKYMSPGFWSIID